MLLEIFYLWIFYIQRLVSALERDSQSLFKNDCISSCSYSKFDCVTLFILEFVRSVVTNDLTERTDSLISVVNDYQPLWINQNHEH